MVSPVRFKQTSDNYTFLAYAVENSRSRRGKESTGINAPGFNADDNLILNLQGVKQLIIYDIVLVPVDLLPVSDLSDGTAPTIDFPDGVQSLSEQKTFLEEYFDSADFGAGFEVEWPGESVVKGLVQDLEVVRESSTLYRCQIVFQRGDVV